MTGLADRLHECKRGLSTLTPNEYNEIWREYTDMQKRIRELEAECERLRAARESWYCENCGCERCLQAEALKDD